MVYEDSGPRRGNPVALLSDRNMVNITLPPAQPRTLESEKSRDQLAATAYQVQLVGGRTANSPFHTHHHSPSRVNAT